jgi:hypothetical protein
MIWKSSLLEIETVRPSSVLISREPPVSFTIVPETDLIPPEPGWEK